MFKAQCLVLCVLGFSVASASAESVVSCDVSFGQVQSTETNWLIAPKRDKKLPPPKPMPRLPILPKIPPA
jgi:hypothetical protein